MMVNKIRYGYGDLVNHSSLDTSIHIMASYETQMHKTQDNLNNLTKLQRCGHYFERQI